MDHASIQVGNRSYDLIGHFKPDPFGGDGDWIFEQRSGDRLPLHCHGRELTFSFRLMDAVGVVKIDRHSQLVRAHGSSVTVPRAVGAQQRRLAVS